MTRTELFQIADKHGIKRGEVKALVPIRKELLAYYTSEVGQEEIRSAPRIPVEFNESFPLSEQPATLIVNLLMQEVEYYAKNS